jgi:hypothetical protein
MVVQLSWHCAIGMGPSLPNRPSEDFSLDGPRDMLFQFGIAVFAEKTDRLTIRRRPAQR